MTQEKKTIAIYHKDCNDGTTAAAVFLKKFPHAELYPLAHTYTKEEISSILKGGTPQNTEVYTLDCALGVREALEKNIPVTTVDHHISIKDDMGTLAKDNPLFTFIFDNEKSGASLAWNYFFPDAPAPKLIGLVEAYDIWNENLDDNARGFSRYLTRFTNQPEEVLPLLDSFPEKALTDGKAVLEYEQTLIEQALEKGEPLHLSIGEYSIPAYNATQLKNELGAAFSHKYNSVTCIFNIKKDGVRFSFRSSDEHNPSALDIAKLVGGGGHRNAAGALISLDEFKKILS